MPPTHTGQNLVQRQPHDTSAMQAAWGWPPVALAAAVDRDVALCQRLVEKYASADSSSSFSHPLSLAQFGCISRQLVPLLHSLACNLQKVGAPHVCPGWPTVFQDCFLSPLTCAFLPMRIN